MTAEKAVASKRCTDTRTNFLVHPVDGMSFEGRALLFIWDTAYLRASARRARITIRKRLINQSPEEAFAQNESLIEEDVELVQFLILDIARLGTVESDFVWRVEVLGHGGREGAPTALSEIRTFSCVANRLDLTRLHPPQEWTGPEFGPVATPGSKPRVKKGVAALACPNGDVEMGSFQNWLGLYGSRLNSATIYLNSLQQGIVPGRHTIVTPGLDSLLAPLGVNIARVGEGNYAIRLGNSSTSGEADCIAYTFVVTPQNQYFSFRYALVLEDGGHSSAEQPYFCFYVVRGPSFMWSPNNLPVVSRQVVADPSNPFFGKKGDIVYRDWTPTCLDLGAYLGETMTIFFGVTDCAQGGHFGYVYIDALCVSNQASSSFTVPTDICRSDELWADGSASAGEASHFWSIEESDSGWGRNPQTEVSQWYVAQKAGPINLTAFYQSKGGAFKCNTHYRIKLAVANDCTPWNESVQLVFIRCPKVSAGPDRCVSCTPNGKTAQLGTGSSTPQAGHYYTWTPSAGLSNPNVPRPFHQEGSVPYPITYTLRVVDAKGCAGEDSVTLHCRPPNIAIKMIEGCCSVTLIAHAGNYSNLTWSTGATGVDMIQVSQPGTYSVTVSNPCASASATVTVPATLGLTGPFNPVAAESRVGSSPLPNAMHIKDVVVGSPAGIAGVPHAYNATEYRLQIFDRWGQVIRTVTGADCQGFPNWSIQWDTTNGWGNPVPQGTYTWRLELKNCTHDWGTPSVRRFKKRTCVRWWINIFGIKLFCRQWDVPDGTTEDIPGGVDSVTVVR